MSNALVKTEDQWRQYINTPQVVDGIARYCKGSGVESDQIITGFSLAIRKSILTQTGNRPIITDCTAYSVMTCILKAAQMGLVPDGSEAALAPFRNNKAGTVEATFMPMYRGLVKLALRHPDILSVTAGAIRENDFFEAERGSNPHLIHRPPLDERGKLIGSWALAKMRQGADIFVTLGAKDIARHRRPSRNDHLWDDEPEGNAEPMWTKSAVHELIKWLPSRDLQRVEELEHYTDRPMTIDVQALTDAPKTKSEDIRRRLERSKPSTIDVADQPPQRQTEPEYAEEPPQYDDAPITDEDMWDESVEMAAWREELAKKRKADTVAALMEEAHAKFPARRMDCLNTFLAECRSKMKELGD